RVTATRPRREGTPLWELATRIRRPRFAPGGTLSAGHPGEQDRLQQPAAPLADVCQRSSANVEGRHGYLSLPNPPLRGLDHSSKRTWLMVVPTFCLTRAASPTAAERFFGQPPRSRFAAL